MNLRSKLAAIALATGIAIIPATAQHQRANAGQQGEFGQRMLDRAVTVLSLTEAQKAATAQIMADAKAKAEPLRAQLKQTREDLHAATKANNTDNISQL